MKKLLKLAKWPLTICSSVVFVVFMVVLMVVCLIPHGTTYTYSTEIKMGNYTAEYITTYTFLNDKEVEVEVRTKYSEELAKLAGEPEELYTYKVFYKIKDGELFASATEDGEYTKGAQINSFEIKIKNPSLGDVTVSLTCSATCVLRDLSIAFMCIGGVLLAGSVVIIVLDKKGIIKTKEKAENTEDVAA